MPLGYCLQCQERKQSNATEAVLGILEICAGDLRIDDLDFGGALDALRLRCPRASEASECNHAKAVRDFAQLTDPLQSLVSFLTTCMSFTFVCPACMVLIDSAVESIANRSRRIGTSMALTLIFSERSSCTVVVSEIAM